MKRASCILSIFFTLLMFCMMPFSVFALSEELPAPFIGVNIYQDDAEYNGPYGKFFINKVGDNYRIDLVGGNYNLVIPLWHYDFVLDSNYVGSVDVQYTSGSTSITDTFYVNGNHLEINIYGQTTSFVISNVQLQDLGNTISWAFPIESFGAISTPLNYKIPITEYTHIRNWTFPFFDVNQGDTLIDDYYSDLTDAAQYKKYIFGYQVTSSLGGQINSDEIFKRYFGFYSYNGTNVDSEFVVEYEKLLFRFQSGKQFRISSFKIKRIANNSGSSTYYIRPKASFTYLPIYWNVYYNNNISTDFALNFGLSNDFLDALVYGTDGTNQSSSNLNTASDNMNSEMNNLVGIEDGYNQQFNNSINAIDFSSPINGNSNLLSSANFVITAFNGLISNNFLSTLIIVVCILIVGKKVIGK